MAVTLPRLPVHSLCTKGPWTTLDHCCPRRRCLSNTNALHDYQRPPATQTMTSQFFRHKSSVEALRLRRPHRQSASKSGPFGSVFSPWKVLGRFVSHRHWSTGVNAIPAGQSDMPISVNDPQSCGESSRCTTTSRLNKPLTCMFMVSYPLWSAVGPQDVIERESARAASTTPTAARADSHLPVGPICGSTAPASAHVSAIARGIDRAGDIEERRPEIGAQRGDGDDDDDRDQSHHEAVLNRGGATVPGPSEPEVKSEKPSVHHVPFREARFVCLSSCRLDPLD